MTTDIETYGRIAYEKYAAVSDGKSLVSGDPLPAWNDLKPSIQRAWNAAANAVADTVRSDETEPESMPETITITIYCASDDLVEVAGCDGGGEFNDDDWGGDLVAPDGTQMRVYARYGAGEDSGCWEIGVSQVTEEHQLPGWPVTITQTPAMNPDNAGYSPLLTITAPEGTRLVTQGDDEQDAN